MDKKAIASKVKEALEKAKKRNFKQSVEVCFNFKGIDMESPENKLNLSVLLPKGRGKGIEIGVFAEGDMALGAKKISKHILDKKDIDEFSKDKRKMRKLANSCYGFIAQPDLMAQIGKTWGIVLGPRGKMPQPLPPNADLNSLMEKLKNTVKIKSKKNPTVQVPVGTEDMNSDDIADNILAVYNTIERQIHKDKIRSVYFKATMGPTVRLW